MKKYCPIVKINLPIDQGMYAHLYYCDTHSLTIELFPTNAYHIPDLTESVMESMRQKGCIIHPHIKEYRLYDWLMNKDTYLKDIRDFNNLTKEEVEIVAKYIGNEGNDDFHCMNASIHNSIEWLGLGLL